MSHVRHDPMRNTNGHYERIAPVVRLHPTFGPRRRTWRDVAFGLVLLVGLPVLAFLFFVLTVFGLVYLLAALGRAVRVLSGG
jgi:hypothetical protein